MAILGIQTIFTNYTLQVLFLDNCMFQSLGLVQHLNSPVKVQNLLPNSRPWGQAICLPIVPQYDKMFIIFLQHHTIGQVSCFLEQNSNQHSCWKSHKHTKNSGFVYFLCLETTQLSLKTSWLLFMKALLIRQGFVLKHLPSYP